MFTPFYTLRETGCGTGLGLAICERLARLLSNGSISIQSKVDKGTTVTLQCSLREGIGNGANIDQRILDHLEVLGIIIFATKQKKLSQTLPEMLERQGIKNIFVTDNFTELEKKMKEIHSFRIVLIDHVVLSDTGERMEALEVVKRLSKWESLIPVVMVTEEQRESLLPLLTRERFITKPIRYHALVSIIRKVIHLSSNSMEMMTTPTLRAGVKLEDMKVLIAEDNEMMRNVLQKLIVGLGMGCTAVPNGLECVNEYVKNPQKYDIIIMDCIMPTMTGFQASLKIRDYEKLYKLKCTPIVALTATKSESIHQNCLSVGMNDCVIKPVKRQTLIEVFHKFKTVEVAPEEEKVVVDKTLFSPPEQTAMPCVLLVEDNAMIAKITQRVLVQSKYQVKLAIHGQEALAMVMENYGEYDVILMDIMMPVMDGITCTKRIRLFEVERGLDAKPIIALTANPMPGHKNECQAAGCTDYAQKPIDYPSLKALVAKYCPVAKLK